MKTEDLWPHGPWKPRVQVCLLVKSCYRLKFSGDNQRDNNESPTFSSVILDADSFVKTVVILRNIRVKAKEKKVI